MSGITLAPAATRASSERTANYGAFGSASEWRARILCVLVLLIAFGMRVYQPGKIIRPGEPQPADNILQPEAWLALDGRSGLLPAQARIGPCWAPCFSDAETCITARKGVTNVTCPTEYALLTNQVSVI